MISLVKPQGKPSISQSNPLAKGLIGVFLINERGGSLLNLVDKSTKLSLVNSGAWTNGIIGPQLNCSTAGDSGAQTLTTPAILKPAKAVSVLWQGTVISKTASAQYMCINFNNDNLSPFFSYAIGLNGAATNYNLAWSADGASQSFLVGINATDGQERQLLLTIKGGSQVFYENGRQTGTNTGAFTNITYGGAPSFNIGLEDTGLNRNSQSKCSLLYVWNRVIASEEALMLYANPLKIFYLPTYRNTKNL